METLYAIQLGEGDAPPLVMLHGWGQDHRALKPLGQLLGRGRPVHLLDLPGFGQSETPPKEWSATDYAACVEQYLSERGIGQCDLFGHSFGGKVAVTFSKAFSDKVRRLVLCNASGLPRKQSFERKAIRFLGKATKQVDRAFNTSLFKERFTPRFASTDYLSSGPMREILVRSVNEDISATAQEVRAKTLLIWGERDEETPLYMGRRYQQLIANSELLILEGKTHSPFENAGHHLLTTYMEPFLQ